jgi:hypothetical protein
MKKTAICLATMVLFVQTVCAQNRNIVPLEYVSEFYLAQDGSWNTTHESDKVGWFNMETGEDIRVIPKGYHYPSSNELNIIIPHYIWQYRPTNPSKQLMMGFDRISTQTDVDDKIEMRGTSYGFLSDFTCTGKNIIYAIRFKGYEDQYRCAYRYERIGTFGKSGYGDKKAHLLIQAKYLGPGFRGGLEDVANEEFWSKGEIVTRVFPACGRRGLEEDPHYSLLGGEFSLSAKDGARVQHWADLERLHWESAITLVGDIRTSHTLDGIPYCSVRPFLNKLPEQPILGEPLIKREVFKPVPKSERPQLPIERIADFNVGKTPKTFASSQNIDDSGLYLYSEIEKVIPAGYHLPTYKEWLGVFPSKVWTNYAGAKNNNPMMNWDEIIFHDGVTRCYGADYFFKFVKHVDGFGYRYDCYGLKFKGEGNRFLSAYYYTIDTERRVLKVACRYLGPTFKGDIHDLYRDDDFWEQDDVIVKEFPLAGERDADKDDKVEDAGKKGVYWFQTAKYACQSYSIKGTSLGAFEGNDYFEQGNYSTRFGIAIRPFKDL